MGAIPVSRAAAVIFVGRFGTKGPRPELLLSLAGGVAGAGCCCCSSLALRRERCWLPARATSDTHHPQQPNRQQSSVREKSIRRRLMSLGARCLL